MVLYIYCSTGQHYLWDKYLKLDYQVTRYELLKLLLDIPKLLFKIIV